MKTNITLLVILSLMLVGVYLDQEVYEKEEQKKELIEKSLFKKAEFKKLEFKKSSLVKEDGIWKNKELAWPLNPQKVDEFLNILHSLQIKQKILEFDLDQYFTKKKFVFKVFDSDGEQELWFGDSIEATGRFYVYSKQTGELFICEDTSNYSVPYSSARDYGLKKYLRLTQLLEMGTDLFWESNFIKGLKLGQLNRVDIDSVRNRPLEIDLISGKTMPQAPKPLDYKDLRKTVQDYFGQIRVLKVIGSGQNFLSDQRSVIKLEGNQVYTLRYFSGLNEKFGKYVRIEGLDLIFQVDMDAQNIFFLTGNDFWLKRFHYSQSLTNLSKLDFSLATDDIDWKTFRIYDLEKFKIKTLSEGVSYSQVHINVLFNLMLNLVDFKEAIYVESLSDNQLSKKGSLRAKLLGKEVRIWVENDFIKVIDKEHKLLYHFPDAGDQIRPGFFRSAFTVK